MSLCLLCCVSKRYAMDMISVAGEEAIRGVRVRLVDKLRQGEMQFLEKTGHSDIYARITQDTTIISQSADKGVMLADFSLLIIMVLLYTAWVSLSGFIIISLLLTISSLIFFAKYFEIEKELEASRIKEANLFDALDDITFGFKEIRLNSRKNNEVFSDFDSLAREAEVLKADAAVKFNENIILTYIIFFVLAGSIVFVLPLYTHASNEAIIKLIAALLYIYGPLVGLFQGIPEFALANVAAANLEDLESRLDASGANIMVKEPDTHAFQRDCVSLRLFSVCG